MLSDFRSNSNPANGCQYRFLSDGNTGYCLLSHDLAPLARGNLYNSGTSFILTWVHADTASLDCPVHRGKRENVSNSLATVICDAEEPSSVKTALELKLVFATSSLNTNRPV